jgi:hypothetical protein
MLSIANEALKARFLKLRDGKVYSKEQGAVKSTSFSVIFVAFIRLPC